MEFIKQNLSWIYKLGVALIFLLLAFLILPRIELHQQAESTQHLQASNALRMQSSHAYRAGTKLYKQGNAQGADKKYKEYQSLNTRSFHEWYASIQWTAKSERTHASESAFMAAGGVLTGMGLSSLARTITRRRKATTEPATN